MSAAEPKLVVKKLVPSHTREIAKWTGLDEAEVSDTLKSIYTSKYGAFNNDTLVAILVVSKISDLKHIVKWHHVFPHTDEDVLLEGEINQKLLNKWVGDVKAGVNLEFAVSEWKTDTHLLLKSLGFRARLERGTEEDIYVFELVKNG